MTHSFRQSLTVSTLPLMLGTLLALGSAQAATITVTTAADVVAADGACSLREAVGNANANAATHADCVAGTGADTVVFVPAITSIALTSELVLNDAANTTLNGAGAVTLDGGGATRLLRVNAGAAASLLGLTLQNGNGAGGSDSGHGGALLSRGGLLVERSTLRNNTAGLDGGAINNIGGTLDVRQSRFETNTAGNIGGAIHSTGSALGGGALRLTVAQSHFTGNTATEGGGIAVWGGGLRLEDSTLDNNTAAGGRGGGVLLVGPEPATLENTTLVNNRATFAGGGVRMVASNAAPVLRHLTLADNTPTNIDTSIGTLTLENTVLHQTSATASNCAVSGSGTIVNSGGNVQWGGTAGTSCGAAITQANPLLGPLQANGGFAPTMRPSVGSAAINAANCSLGQDQRGVFRPDVASLSAVTPCDSGAVEAGGVYLLEVGIAVPGQGSVSAGATPAPDLGAIAACEDSGANCFALYSPDPTVPTVLLTATPAPGYQFDRWEDEACTPTNTNPANVVMNQGRACLAYFRIAGTAPPTTPTTAIPTLSEWGLLLLGLLAAGLGARGMRKRAGV